MAGALCCRMRQLNWIAALAMIRHNPLLCIFVYLPLQIMFLYDFHILNLLEAWQTRYGRYARVWFNALGKFEALCSLAAVAHDHPQWAMPEVSLSAERFNAQIGPSALALPGARGQRRGGRAGRFMSPGHRFKHVRQKHAA